MNELMIRREEIADLRYGQYQFGRKITRVEKWAKGASEDEMVLSVFFEDAIVQPTSLTPRKRTEVKGTFVLKFYSDSPVVADEYAIVNGKYLGRPAPTSNNTAEEIWRQLCNIRIDEEDKLAASFHIFCKGTRRQALLDWIEERDFNYAVMQSLCLF